MACLSEVKKILKKYNKKRILLTDIMRCMPAHTEYEVFAVAIKELIEEDILLPIKNSGFNNRVINLPNQFELDKNQLNKAYKKHLQKHVQSLSSEIDLDYYFKHDEEEWLRDKKYVFLVDTYIKENGLPKESATIPERSYQLAGDEKWLQEKAGLQILERVDLVNKMKLIKGVEPTAFAINKALCHQSSYNHLIVENKSIFYRILEFLDETPYSTLIYGGGWRVISGIQSFRRQFPFKDKCHVFYYFGDLDYEGIKIWETLNTSFPIKPEYRLYNSLLKLSPSKGKENQKSRVESIGIFCESAFFDEDNSCRLFNLLTSGCYIPQEALSIESLKKTLIINKG